MASYYGSYLHTLDTKGRVSIPSEMRKASGDVFVLTRGFEECLNLYPLDEWRRTEERLRTLPAGDARARRFKRMLLANAADVQVDAQGRDIVEGNLAPEDFESIQRGCKLLGRILFCCILAQMAFRRSRIRWKTF